MRKFLAVSLATVILGGVGIVYATPSVNNRKTQQGITLSQSYTDLKTKMMENRQEIFKLKEKYKDTKDLIKSAEYKKLQAEFLTIQKALVDERVKLGILTKEQGEVNKATIEKNIASCDGTKMGTRNGNGTGCKGEGQGSRQGMRNGMGKGNGSGSGCGMRGNR